MRDIHIALAARLKVFKNFWKNEYFYKLFKIGKYFCIWVFRIL